MHNIPVQPFHNAHDQMDIRTDLAGRALLGLLSNGTVYKAMSITADQTGTTLYKLAASCAVNCADALINELNKHLTK